MLRFFFNHLLVDCFSLSLLVFDVCKLLSACTFSSLSPILVVSSVVLHQEFMISLFELLILFLVDDNEDRSQFLGVIWVITIWGVYRCNELTLSNLLYLLVNTIS
jgi:hypothetical protein